MLGMLLGARVQEEGRGGREAIDVGLGTFCTRENSIREQRKDHTNRRRNLTMIGTVTIAVSAA